MCWSLHSPADSSVKSKPRWAPATIDQRHRDRIRNCQGTLDVIHSFFFVVFFFDLRQFQEGAVFTAFLFLYSCSCLNVFWPASISYHFPHLKRASFLPEEYLLVKTCWDNVLILAKLNIKSFDPLRMKIYARVSSCSAASYLAQHGCQERAVLPFLKISRLS